MFINFSKVNTDLNDPFAFKANFNTYGKRMNFLPGPIL
jgi:hypothetical protein